MSRERYDSTPDHYDPLSIYEDALEELSCSFGNMTHKEITKLVFDAIDAIIILQKINERTLENTIETHERMRTVYTMGIEAFIKSNLVSQGGVSELIAVFARGQAEHIMQIIELRSRENKVELQG